MIKKKLYVLCALISVFCLMLTMGVIGNADEDNAYQGEAEKVEYLYPEYYDSTSPEKGIKEWKTGEITEYTLVTKSATSKVIWTSGYYVIKGNLTFKGIVCDGDVHIILTDGSSLTSKGTAKPAEKYAGAGITVNKPSSLTIYAQSTDEDKMGSVTATGIYSSSFKDKTSSGAGIGGDCRKASGAITINGGKITATGGTKYASGIGGGSRNDCSDIIINGGVIIAKGGEGGAGIGGGAEGFCFDIVINGGSINAKGGSGAAGIGGGNNGSCDGICINDATVYSVGGKNGAGIGGGYLGFASDITVNNGIVKAIGGVDAAGMGGGVSGDAELITIKAKSVYAISGAPEVNGLGGGKDGTASEIYIASVLRVYTSDSLNYDNEILIDRTDSTDLSNKISLFKMFVIAEESHNCEFGTFSKTITQYSNKLESGYYCLMSDIKLNTKLVIEAGKEVHICLNGHTLTGNGDTVICNFGGDLQICDCSVKPEDIVGIENYEYSGGVIKGGSGQNGGAIYNTGKLYVDGVTFEGNEARERAGAIISEYTETTTIINNCVFKNNKANIGGALQIRHGTPAVIRGCVFEGNSANVGGGTIDAIEDAYVIISDSLFTDNGVNTCNYEGGAVIHTEDALLTVDSTTFDSNKCRAIYLKRSIGTIDDAVITNNTAGIGAGLYVGESSICSMLNIKATGNTAGERGGGIFIHWQAGHTTLHGNCIVEKNTAKGNSDNLYLEYDRVLELTAVTGRIGVTLQCNPTGNEKRQVCSASGYSDDLEFFSDNKDYEIDIEKNRSVAAVYVTCPDDPALPDIVASVFSSGGMRITVVITAVLILTVGGILIVRKINGKSRNKKTVTTDNNEK